MFISRSIRALSTGKSSFRKLSNASNITFSSSSQRGTKSSLKYFAYASLSGVIAYVVVDQSTVVSSCSSNLAAAQKEIEDMIEADSERRGDGSSIGPTLVRLAWHASGTYSAKDKSGGSNGATMRFPPEATWGANAGLSSARDFLVPIKEKYKLSSADTWTLAGAVAIQAMGGPKVAWRSGRTDSPNPTTVPDGRLPGADKGCPKMTIEHIRDIFGRMGFSDREMVALIGAHALGRCHTDASGYWGPWTRAETTFSNEYFRLLLEEKWTVKKTHEGKPWTGPVQFESPDGTLMMLPADIALIQDAEFRKYVELYAKDEEVFFKDFASAFSKLLELGVVFPWNSSKL